MFPLAFVAEWLQGHWWGFISRNYVVWPTFLLMNVFIALKGSHFWFLFLVTRLVCFYGEISKIIPKLSQNVYKTCKQNGKESRSWSVSARFVQLFEPTHEILAFFVLRKFILQICMHSHPVGLDVWFLVRPFIYFHTSCVQTSKALARLHGCTGSPEPSLVAYAISTKISWAGSFRVVTVPFYS